MSQMYTVTSEGLEYMNAMRLLLEGELITPHEFMTDVVSTVKWFRGTTGHHCDNCGANGEWRYLDLYSMSRPISEVCVMWGYLCITCAGDDHYQYYVEPIEGRFYDPDIEMCMKDYGRICA